jgi:hypothetical protein
MIEQLTASVSLAAGAIGGALNLCQKTELCQFHQMAPHSKGKGVKHLSPEDKASIIAYRATGMATSEIASRMGRNRSTIKRVLAASRALPEKGVPPRKKGSGRKKKLTDDLLVILTRQI